MSNGFKTSRNRRHLRPALEKNAEDPDISFSDDPENDYIINRDHECDDTCDSEENNEEIQTEIQTEVPVEIPRNHMSQRNGNGRSMRREVMSRTMIGALVA